RKLWLWHPLRSPWPVRQVAPESDCVLVIYFAPSGLCRLFSDPERRAKNAPFALGCNLSPLRGCYQKPSPTLPIPTFSDTHFSETTFPIPFQLPHSPKHAKNILSLGCWLARR